MRRLVWGWISHLSILVNFYIFPQPRSKEALKKNKSKGFNRFLQYAWMISPLIHAYLPRLVRIISSCYFVHFDQSQAMLTQRSHSSEKFGGGLVCVVGSDHTNNCSFLQLPHVVTWHSVLLCSGASEFASLLLWHVWCLYWIDVTSLANEKGRQTHVVRIHNRTG